MNYCPLGLECVFDESAPFDRKNCCANIDTCYTWTTAWELPYRQAECGLVVDFLDAYNNAQSDIFDNPITSKYDWRKYFTEYGFAEAVDLPYISRASNNTIYVYIANDNVCREQIQEAGYADAISLPIHKRKEYYSPDAYNGFSYLEVDLFFCGDEAINALNAGYADACSLLIRSLSEQKQEYG